MFYVAKNEIDTESLRLQNMSPIMQDKSFYTPAISFSTRNTENQLISPSETPTNDNTKAKWQNDNTKAIFY